jgi:hypothetical protein
LALQGEPVIVDAPPASPIWTARALQIDPDGDFITFVSGRSKVTSGIMFLTHCSVTIARIDLDGSLVPIKACSLELERHAGIASYMAQQTDAALT